MSGPLDESLTDVNDGINAGVNAVADHATIDQLQDDVHHRATFDADRVPRRDLKVFFFTSRRRHTRSRCDWSSDVCSSDLVIPKMPPDTKIVRVSRTIGDERLVDEMIFQFTHTIEMDWMLPGIAPTGKRVECPLVVIVHFRDGKLANEHIYWDQASVLVQLGLLDAAKLPVAGVETARKLADPSMPSNRLIERAKIGRGA